MAVILKIIDIIIFAGIVQGFFLAIVLHNTKNLKRRQNRILSVLLVILSLAILQSVFIADIPEQLLQSPFKIKEPFILLIGPLLWFYVKEITSKASGFKAKSLLHFIPFALFCAFFVPFHIHGDTTAFTNFFYNNATVGTIVTLVLVLLQYTYYFYKISDLTKIHQKNVEQEFSNIEDKTLSWIKFLLAAFFIVYIFLVIALVFLFHQISLAYFDKTISVILSVLIFGLGYKGLLQKEIFSNISIDDSNADKIAIKSIVFEKNETHTKELLELMDKMKPYLNPELTLDELAKELKVSRNVLSQIINNNIGENFYYFVNKYRVEEVKGYLSDSKKKHFTILSLAFDAGFNSKSAFNSIFKRVTGLSPSEYRNRLN